LLKRFVSGPTSVVAPAGTGNLQCSFNYPIFPTSQAPLSSGTIVSNDLFSYLRYAYLGYRGGVRWRIHSQAPINDGTTSNVKVWLQLPSTTQAVASAGTWTTSTLGSSNFEGTVAQIPATNGGVEAELPFYTNNLFQIAWSQTLDSGVTSENMNGLWYRNFFVTFEGLGNVLTNQIMTEYASAEDFCFMRYQGAVPYSS